MYAKKHSWSNAHIRWKFFAGLKTTSRCEALNMQLGKFIHNGYNLREFVEHFQHYLEFMRRRELVADYKSAYGEPIVKTKLEAIEQFAATVYTREVFELFREVLMLASNVRVVSTKRTSACVLFEVAMYCKQRSWAVSWAEKDDEFSCSCQRMESFGLPCVHMVGVLVYLNMTAIPKGLILDRWTKRAKQPRAPCDGTRVGEIPDAAYMSMHAAISPLHYADYYCFTLVDFSIIKCGYFFSRHESGPILTSNPKPTTSLSPNSYPPIDQTKKKGSLLHAGQESLFPPPLPLSITDDHYKLLLAITVSRDSIFIMLLCLASGRVLFPISHTRPISFSIQDFHPRFATLTSCPRRPLLKTIRHLLHSISQYRTLLQSARYMELSLSRCRWDCRLTKPRLHFIKPSRRHRFFRWAYAVLRHSPSLR
ncbi:hypothetical protein AHAS_Ahas17G0062100 [Arachis hypogaea]